MKRVLAVLLIGTGTFASGGCLQSRTSHVLYLSPSGAVTWTVYDHDVHSDEADRAKRAQEEADFLHAIQNRTHGPLLDLEAIGGRNATTELTRTERPWDAVTTARFDRIETRCSPRCSASSASEDVRRYRRTLAVRRGRSSGLKTSPFPRRHRCLDWSKPSTRIAWC